MMWLRFETAESIRGIACGNPLEDRFRLSVEALIRWIVKD